jgi:hypothetical protein
MISSKAEFFALEDTSMEDKTASEGNLPATPPATTEKILYRK